METMSHAAFVERLWGRMDLTPSAEEDLIQEERLIHVLGVYLSIQTLAASYMGGQRWEIGAALALAAGLSSVRRTFPLAMAILAAYGLHRVMATFPLTPNHKYLELFVFVTLLVLPARRAGGLLRYAILSVYFYAGLQKLVRGYYWSGEALAIEALTSPAGGAQFLRAEVHALASWLGWTAPSMLQPAVPNWLGAETIVLPEWVKSFLRFSARSAVVIELALPLLLLRRSTRTGASIALVLFALYATVAADEFRFGSINLGLVLLFFPRAAVWSYPLAFMSLHFLGELLGNRGGA